MKEEEKLSFEEALKTLKIKRGYITNNDQQYRNSWVSDEGIFILALIRETFFAFI